MKKIQRSFVVEYKSGRRKTDPKSNSIWGNMDLKSVARDVQEASPFLTRGEKVGASDSEALVEVKWTGPLLTPAIGHPTTATATQETIMAEENDTTTINDAPASVVAAIDAPKKQRKPRAKKAAPETASVEVAAEPTTALNTTADKRVKQTRGRKAKSNEVAVSAKSVPVKRGPKAVRAATPAPAAALDEFSDLLKLEEENQRLRKLLAEKLRAENSDLRKRLNLG